MIPSKSFWLVRTALALLFAINAVPALAQDKVGEPLLVKRAAQLRDAPGEGARVLASLQPPTAVMRSGERQGAWVKVTLVDGSSGWLHMFDTTSATSPASGNFGTSALRGLTGFLNKGNSSAQQVSVATSTLGIRGLGASDITNAQPNVAALVQADGARIDAAQARQFASFAQLSARQVEPLPMPVPTPSAAPARSSNGPSLDADMNTR